MKLTPQYSQTSALFVMIQKQIPGVVCGAPDLVVEILSPGNSHKEVKLKFELYEEAGVKEYWIVYPEEESVAVFLLDENGRYNGAALYAGKDKIHCEAVPGLIVDTKEIFTQ